MSWLITVKTSAEHGSSLEFPAIFPHKRHDFFVLLWHKVFNGFIVIYNSALYFKKQSKLTALYKFFGPIVKPQKR